MTRIEAGPPSPGEGGRAHRVLGGLEEAVDPLPESARFATLPGAEKAPRLALEDLANTAGILTLARVPLALVFPFFVDRPGAALGLYLGGAFTDVIDGHLARRTGTASPAGAVADGIADKLFHGAVAYTLVMSGRVPPWWIGLWFSREIGQGLNLVWLVTHRGVELHRLRKADALGKVATMTLGASIVSALVGFDRLALAAAVATGVLGLASAVGYARRELAD